jgi:hypothetical protein
VKLLHYFEIQHYTFLEGWTNTWSDGQGTPIRFESRESAEGALWEFFEDMEEAAALEELQPYEETEFRIMKVPVM